MGLDLASREVVAVVAGLALVGGLIYAASLYRGPVVEPFHAIGLLGPDCLFAGYPSVVVNGSAARLCLLLVNHDSRPALFKVVYRIAAPGELPSREAPSPAPPVEELYYSLPPVSNTTVKITVPVSVGEAGRRALVFELWLYSPERHGWVYSGKWAHLYVTVVPAP